MAKGYAWEKLFVAVDCLATGTEPLQNRLEYAMSGALVTLTASDFADDEARRRYESIRLAFSSELRGPRPEGGIAAAAAAMTDERVVEIARAILSLYDEVATS